MPPVKPIVVEGVSFSYNGADALRDVSFTLEERDFVAAVGPNGGGKTTLLKLLLGLLQPQKGTIRILGEPPARARHRIGYLTQHFECDLSFPLRVWDVVLMGRLRRHRFFSSYSRHDREAATRALEEVELFALKDRSFAALSGGERQRVLIARALATEPELLLLDEPTANVDIKVERELYDLLKDLNSRLPILMATHDLGFVSSYVNKVLCINRRVVMHPTSEITGEMISKMYGSEVVMVRHDQLHTGDDS